ncbi:MAG: DNA phosphorothioation system sulfurtransferase DndC [Roseiflexaceae bacterium]|jgi:DNA sulfur modification protein DndC
MSNTTTKSVFENRTLNDVYEEVRQVYRSSQLPWIIGYSGGKDSTATLQLVWYALRDLPDEERIYPVYVIASDTLVETPIIVNHLQKSLDDIRHAADAVGLPIYPHKVIPELSDTFWVNLIGRGYPAPNQRFRWCTDRMKISPANKFILDRANEFGEVVMVLGGRKSESASRAQVINNAHAKVTGSRLSRHHVLSRAYVYTPIEDFSTDDVWTYLLQVPSPWGANNRDLAAMYRTAHSGECPLVIDDTTPSCGNSRFGCWTCTVVTRDKSMEAMIDNGEEWMIPMLEFRDWLAETQDPARKHLFREHKRRTGQVSIKDGKLIRGPYKLEFCKEILRKLLLAQMRVRSEGRDKSYELITQPELHEIRRIWRTERQDWNDSVPVIYHEVTQQHLAWLQDDIGSFNSMEYQVLDGLCKEHDIPTDLVARLLEQERQMQGMQRRAGIQQKIDDVLREEWRDEDTIRHIYNIPLIVDHEED